MEFIWILVILVKFQSMTIPQQIAKHFREVHFGGNWTSVNLKDQASDISWQHATTRVGSLNTIAALVFHINYYVCAILDVLHGNILNAHDQYSFDLPPIENQEDWDALLTKTWKDAELFSTLVERFPESRLQDTFFDERYGNYYRNFQGVIEHTHYHLGQIAIIRKFVLS